MKRTVTAESAPALIDAKINELADWRGKMLAKVREIIHKADPEIVEEWKWMGIPVFSHGGALKSRLIAPNLQTVSGPFSFPQIYFSKVAGN
jgi:hypothetical protein